MLQAHVSGILIWNSRIHCPPHHPLGIKRLVRVAMGPALPYSETLLDDWALKSWCFYHIRFPFVTHAHTHTRTRTKALQGKTAVIKQKFKYKQSLNICWWYNLDITQFSKSIRFSFSCNVPYVIRGINTLP